MKEVTTLLKEELGINRIKKISVTGKDNLYTLNKKIANYIYRNGDFNGFDEKMAVITIAKINHHNVVNVKKVGENIGWAKYSNLASYDVSYFDDEGKVNTINYLVSEKDFKAENNLSYYAYSDYVNHILLNRSVLIGYSKIYDKIIRESEGNVEENSKLFRNLMFGSKWNNRKQCIIRYSFGLEENSGVEKPLFRIFNDILQANHERQLAKQARATAFVTKKQINKETIETMENTKLNKYFKFVELDNQVDLNKFRIVEKDMYKLNAKLPKGLEKTKLRFRKLGNYKANGVFFPSENCLCVDFRESQGNVGIQSFVHEYGHYLDYNTEKDNVLSRKKAFYDIVEVYKKNVRGKLKGKARTESYFTEPTEVFARGFELYINQKGYSGNLIKEENKYQSEEEYKGFDENLKDKVFKFFEKNLAKVEF